MTNYPDKNEPEGTSPGDLGKLPQSVAPEIQTVTSACRIDHEGTTISIHGLKVSSSQKPPIVIAHDVGESIERYEAISKALAGAGYSVYGFTMRGHETNVRLSSIPGFNILSNDLLQVLAWVKYKEDGRKPIIFARGMGALLALSLSRAHTKFFQGLILASPMFNLNYNLTPFRRFLIGTLAEVAPALRLPRWLGPTFTNSNQETYVFAGKKRHPKLNSHFTFELLNSIAQSRKLLKRLKIPSLIICPSNDPALRYEFLKPLVQRHRYSGRFTLKYVEGADNLPLAEGGDSLKYLSVTVTKWLQEFTEGAGQSQWACEDSPVSTGATVVSESTSEVTGQG